MRSRQRRFKKKNNLFFPSFSAFFFFCEQEDFTFCHLLPLIQSSECKPCSQSCEPPTAQLSVQPTSGKGSSSSLSPASVTEDVSLGSTSDDQDACSVVSDYDCPCGEESSSVEDLQSISSSLRDSEYFKDLQGGTLPSQTTVSTVTAVPECIIQESVDLQESLTTTSTTINQPAQTFLTTHSPQLNAPPPSYEQPTEECPPSFVVTQLSPKLLPGGIIDGDDALGPAVGPNLTDLNLNGLLELMETPTPTTALEEGKEQSTMDLDGELDLDSFPILIRSMSTSRRHSWGVPLSPITLGRRLSLDTKAIDSDGERDDDDEQRNNLFQSTYSCSPCPEEEFSSPDAFSLRDHGEPGRQLYSRSQILATDEYSRAAHISRVVQTSKQAARAAGAEEFDPEENLHSTEGQTHIAKQRNNRSDTKDSGSVTWYEFLSNE
ncbi:uncharacterized protein LOC115778865 [Archocentrus centrarchus]|uniref:uncharacterized protein LOC115778865 n=1 Tax=Archocentrus centrarchus TaxID=63155 RepID=UPI0011E9D212|nr:uncharacterized protein LOC115778865 [Archocentrus centrarchus]